MQISLTNVKSTLANENIDITDNVAVTNQVTSIFPDMEGWSYDNVNDVMYIVRPTPPIADTSSIGVVQNIDYTMG